MLEQLESLYGQGVAELEALTDSASLHEWHIRYLGKKGELTLLLRNMGGHSQRGSPVIWQAC